MRVLVLAGLALCAAFGGVTVLGQSGSCSSPGCPDSTFGGTGIVVTPSIAGRIDAIAVQNIGGEERIVGLSGISGVKDVVVRYTGSGQLDTSFGTAGVVSGPSSKTASWALSDVAAQPDNKLLVLSRWPTGARGASSLAVTRYLPNAPLSPPGPYDTEFGTGGVAFLGSSYQASAEEGMALQSDGKIVVVSDAGSNLYVHRVTAGGSLDGSFGNGGVAVVPGGGYADSVAIQRVPNAEGVLEERIVVTSTVYIDFAHQVARLQRFMPDGSPDTTFGEGGVTLHTPNGYEGHQRLAVDASGRIVTGGRVHLFDGTTHTYQVLAARYTADGELDTGFADEGIFRQDLPTGYFGGLAIHPDGRILVTAMPGTNPAYSLVVWRLLDNGTLDPLFGNNGVMTTTAMTSGYLGTPTFVRGGTAFVIGGSALVRKGRSYSTVFAIGRFLY